TFSRPSSSRSSLSHWILVRNGPEEAEDPAATFLDGGLTPWSVYREGSPGIAAFSVGTSRDSGPREITKPPTCCDRWRGKPASALVNAISLRITGECGSKPASRNRSALSSGRSHQTKLLEIRSNWAGSRPSALPTSRKALRVR